MTTQAPPLNPTVPAAYPARRNQIILALLTVYVIWGTTYLAIRVALQSFPPYMLMSIRFLIAGTALFVFARMRGTPLPTMRQWRSSLIVGGLLLLGGMGGVALAENAVSSGLAATLVVVSPLWMMMFSLIWGSRPRRSDWTGMILGIAGVALLSLEGNLQANPAGIALLLFSSVSWALGSEWSKHLDLPRGAMGLAAEMIAGGSLLLIGAFLRNERIEAAPLPDALLALVYLIMFGSLATFTAYSYLLRTVRPALATSYALVNPPIALLLGVVLGGEQLTGSALLALPLILTGLMLVVLQKNESVEVSKTDS